MAAGIGVEQRERRWMEGGEGVWKFVGRKREHGLFALGVRERWLLLVVR